MFIYEKTKEEFLGWFSNEIKLIDSNFEIEISESKYDSLLSIQIGEIEMSYSIFNNTAKPGFLCLYVKPKLKFFAALFGKKDIFRERATLLAHSILNGSDEISELGWYLETQVWKAPTSAP